MEEIQKIIKEVRGEFQIPPYFSDEALENYAKEGYARLMALNPGSDPGADSTFRMLLKNYVHYAYYHKVNEWEQNYASLILSWQMSSEVNEND